MLSTWDHTALLASLAFNQIVATASANNPKNKLRPRTMLDMHPYRDGGTKVGSGKITAENITVLRDIGNALVRGR